MKRISLIVASIILTGCAAGSVKELRRDAAARTSVEVALNYQRVFKNVLEKARECIGEGSLGIATQARLQNQIYSELREGEIAYVADFATGSTHYLVIDIKATGAEKTRVDAFVYFESWKPRLAAVKAWAADPSAPCEVAD